VFGLLRCFYHPEYFLPLPEGHPFPMEKFPQAYALLRKQGAGLRFHEPMILGMEDLERVHQPAYLDAVSFDQDASGDRSGLSSYQRHRLGLPANPLLLKRSALEAGGTVAALRCAMEEGFAANLAGGTHHAFPDTGLGYCVLNDVAIAIQWLYDQGSRPQILIVDTDAHQGNANHAFFRDDPGVFTYSIHGGRNYPARKEPGDWDVPLPRWVSGQEYLWELKRTLPEAFSRHEPDLVFWIAGADIHQDDRFGQIALTDEQIALRDEMVIRLIDDYECRAVQVYGGGYNRKPGKTAAIHAASVLRFCQLIRQI